MLVFKMIDGAKSIDCLALFILDADQVAQGGGAGSTRRRSHRCLEPGRVSFLDAAVCSLYLSLAFLVRSRGQL